MPRQLPVWSAPLVPVALAMTVGIVADRFWVVPLFDAKGAVAALIALGNHLGLFKEKPAAMR